MAVDLALKNLLHDKLRFAITVAGVAFAVTLVFVQAGLFEGLMSHSTVTIERMGADFWISAKNSPNVDFSHTFPETRLQRVRSVPGVARADNLIVWFMQITMPTGAQEGIEVYALEDFSRWGVPWRVAEGDLADLKRGHYLFLDDSATKRYGPFRVGDYREILGRRFKIIGRTLEARSFTTTPLGFVDFRLAQSIAPEMNGQTTNILVKLAPGADPGAVKAELERRLPYNDVHFAGEWAGRSRGYWVTNTGLGLNMYITVFLGILVGVVVVAQTLYTATMEHLREYGTVKAIGGSNRDLYLIVAKQAVIAAVFGFAAGGLMAWLLAPAMRAIDLTLAISLPFSLAVFAGTVVLCLGAALISLRKIAALDPALVFRT